METITQDYATSFVVAESPDTLFAAITDPARWWTGEVDGAAAEAGDEFSYRYPGFHFTKQRVTEVVPGQSVVWEVTEADLPHQPDPTEWAGTQIVFEIVTDGDQTELRFTHRGLVSDLACYEACSGGWDFFINSSLKRLVTTGVGPSTPPWAA